MTRRGGFRLFVVGLGATLLASLEPTPARGQERTVDDVLAAVVGVRAEVPATARTAETLGTRREGSGVLIDASGLVLTVGYLILEAGITEIVEAGGRVLPAEIVAYDHETGFGLLRALQPLDAAPMAVGDSTGLGAADPVLAVSRADGVAAQSAVVASRREFAGYWEYLLPDAIFTTPPLAAFAGAALIGRDGRLLGIGSLFVGDAADEGRHLPGNMFVPIDALQPILADLLEHGHRTTAPRPWLGLSSDERGGVIHVLRVATGGPAARAGIEPGDVIVGVAGAPVAGLADFYRRVWALGQAGVEVPLTVGRPSGRREIAVRSIDRYGWLRLDPTY